MQTAYAYLSDTGEYNGIVEIYPTKDKDGNDYYSMPANTTQVAPPEAGQGEVACYNIIAKLWEVKEDHRGNIVWRKSNLEKVRVTWLGPITDDYLTEYPEPKDQFQIWDNGEYIYPPLPEFKNIIKGLLDQKFEQQVQQPYPCGEYYVIPNWATTYTTTLVAMQQDVQEDGILDETYMVLLLKDLINQTFVQVRMNSIDEFIPYYNKVKDVYKKLSTEYHNNIVRISVADTPNKLIKIYNNFNK